MLNVTVRINISCNHAVNDPYCHYLLRMKTIDHMMNKIDCPKPKLAPYTTVQMYSTDEEVYYSTKFGISVGCVVTTVTTAT